MYCSQCGEPLPAPGICCPTCAAQGTRPSEPGPMLARANLMRMRGQWAEAADLCVEVLRIDPANATAHSLLGDIYQDQGQAQEARYWYHLALEHNPSSEADRAKLTRAEETLEARRQRAEWEAVIQGRAQPVATRLLVRESLLRVGALAGAAVCGMILVMATMVSVSERAVTAEDQPAGTGILRRREVFPDTPAERQLLDRLRTAPSDARLVRLQLDPRSRSAALRMILPVSDEQRADLPGYRLAMMREGYRLAQALLTAADAAHVVSYPVDLVEVEVLDSRASREGGSDLLFAGTLGRANLGAPYDRLTRPELRQFYSEVTQPYWARSLGGE